MVSHKEKVKQRGLMDSFSKAAPNTQRVVSWSARVGLQSDHLRDPSHDHLSLLLCNANMLLGHCSYLSSGRQKPDHILMSLSHSKGSRSLFQQKQPCTGNKLRSLYWQCMRQKALEQEAAAASSTCKVRKCAVWAEQSLKVGEGSSPHSRDGEGKRSRWMTDSARGSAWGDCEKEQSAATQAARCDLGTQCTLKTGCPCGSRAVAHGIYRVVSDDLHPHSLLSLALAPSLPHKRLCSTQTATKTQTAFGCWCPGNLQSTPLHSWNA